MWVHWLVSMAHFVDFTWPSAVVTFLQVWTSFHLLAFCVWLRPWFLSVSLHFCAFVLRHVILQCWPFSLCAEYPGDHVLRMIRLKEMHFPPNRFRHKLMYFQWCLAIASFCSLVWPAALCPTILVSELWCDLLSEFKDHTPKSGGPFPPYFFVCASKHDGRVSAACRRRQHSVLHFDSTKGYPGEGPELVSLVSANIGSLNTNHLWKSWGADIICLQETRIGKNNVRTSVRNIEAVGLRPILGQLLPGLWHANGTTKAPCGGTAILGSDTAITPFEMHHDQTGLFNGLFQTKRFAAAWYQVTPKIKALILCVYACTGASSDSRVHGENDKMFADILTLVAQYGDIPVILTGDFQAVPATYPSLAGAMNFHGWVDPLTSTDEMGSLTRPYTYSKDL